MIKEDRRMGGDRECIVWLREGVGVEVLGEGLRGVL
jgi:hypothetical protein